MTVARVSELLDLADLATSRRDHDQAIELLERAVQIEPTSYAYCRLGAAYRRRNRLIDAQSAYLEGFACEEREGRVNPAIRGGLAFVLIELNAPPDRICALLDHALQLRVDRDTFNIVARAYQVLGERERHPMYLDVAARMRNAAETLHEPAAEMSRSADRYERHLRGALVEIRDVIEAYAAPPESNGNDYAVTRTSTGTTRARVRYRKLT